MLRKYLCVEESRAANVGQGHRYIIHLLLLAAAHYVWSTINTASLFNIYIIEQN